MPRTEPSREGQEGRRYLTVAEAAAYLSMSPQTLYNLSSGRAIPRIKLGRSLRFDVKDLDRWMERHKEGAARLL